MVVLFTLAFTGLGRIVAMMERNGMLKVANVGDCGLKIIRTGMTNV